MRSSEPGLIDSQVCPICSRTTITLRSKIITKGERLTWEEESALEIFERKAIDCSLRFCPRCFHCFRLPLFDERIVYNPRGIKLKTEVYQRQFPGEVFYGDCGGGSKSYHVRVFWECANTFQHMANLLYHVGTVSGIGERDLKVLDWGGGDGYLVELISMVSNRVAKIPMTGYCFDIAYGASSPYFNCITKEELEIEAPYDIIILSHILEDVPSPKELLDRCKKYLREQGVIIAVVPYEQYRVLSPIGVGWQHHQHMFSGTSLAESFRRSGLGDMKVSVYRSSHRGIQCWNVQAVAQLGGAPCSMAKAVWFKELPTFIAAAAWAARKKARTREVEWKRPGSIC